LVLILGDQLWLDNPALARFDTREDRVLMVEARDEAAHVWSHKGRIAYFFAAMRHFAAGLRARRWRVDYLRIGTHEHASIEAALADAIAAERPAAVIVCEPGEWRLDRALRAVCERAGVPIEVRLDTHFLASKADFADWAGGAKQLRMEAFYRTMRVRSGVLMDRGKPAGDAWNFDRENRASFGRAGPGALPPVPKFAPDATTRAAIADVERHFAGHPGTLADFAWPVTRDEALAMLEDFVAHRLPMFGQYQDAMWTAEPFLYHSLLSAPMNVRLLDPREVIAAAERAYAAKRAPLAAVEGFIRQILGWREFMRGVYWLDMPGLASANHFGHDAPLPAWYWSAETGMSCMRASVGQTLRYGYAHHIQRLMVTGNFALVAGVAPKAVTDWYLAVYIDAVEWVELPNTAGMSLYANGGRFTTKPYAASGAYIKRMSNYCAGCRYKPEVRTGPQACPITTFYWAFLDRNERELAANLRTALMVKHLARMSASERRALRTDADAKRARLDHL
jgi:deoxyribodipyrimidine photolyase-related protein